MGVAVQTEFIGKATVRVWAYVYDDDDALADPTSINVTIKDKDGAAPVDDEAMSPVGGTDGTYTYDYQTTAATTKGWYNVEVVVVDGAGAVAKTSIGTYAFRIK